MKEYLNLRNLIGAHKTKLKIIFFSKTSNISLPCGCWLLHRNQAEYLEKVILHDVADDAELIEVTATTLSSKRLLEGDDDGRDVVAVPRRAEEPVSESDGHQILNHLFAQVVVNAVELFFFEERRQVVREGGRRGRIFPERLLDDDASPAGLRHGGSLQVSCHRDEHRRRQGQVEKSVSNFSVGFAFGDDGVQVFKVGLLIVVSCDVGVKGPELIGLFLLALLNLTNKMKMF